MSLYLSSNILESYLTEILHNIPKPKFILAHFNRQVKDVLGNPEIPYPTLSDGYTLDWQIAQ